MKLLNWLCPSGDFLNIYAVGCHSYRTMNLFNCKQSFPIFSCIFFDLFPLKYHPGHGHLSSSHQINKVVSIILFSLTFAVVFGNSGSLLKYDHLQRLKSAQFQSNFGPTFGPKELWGSWKTVLYLELHASFRCCKEADNYGWQAFWLLSDCWMCCTYPLPRIYREEGVKVSDWIHLRDLLVTLMMAIF